MNDEETLTEEDQNHINIVIREPYCMRVMKAQEKFFLKGSKRLKYLLIFDFIIVNTMLMVLWQGYIIPFGKIYESTVSITIKNALVPG